MKESESELQQSLPSIIFVGSPNFGKRTLLSRLISVDLEDSSDSPSQELIHRWTINTKYYTADVSVCIAHFHDVFSITTLPAYSHLVALIMVFDMNARSSLVALQDWVSRNDLQRFEILVCVGNKVDLVPGHPVHSEYRRRVLKVGDLSSDHDSDYYGISEAEGSSLLGEGDDESLEIRKLCLEWCSEHNIEFVEACGSNADFDKCLSADGDSQGVERLLGALSAHMWPGMILKSGDKITEPSLPEREELSDEESDYELEYEKLSTGSAEPWDDTEEPSWVSSSDDVARSGTEPSTSLDNRDATNEMIIIKPSTTSSSLPAVEEEPSQLTKVDESSHFDFNELEQVMLEIGNIRENLRLMPDFQRRELAANMALKMASMFGGGSDDDEESLM